MAGQAAGLTWPGPWLTTDFSKTTKQLATCLATLHCTRKVTNPNQQPKKKKTMDNQPRGAAPASKRMTMRRSMISGRVGVKVVGSVITTALPLRTAGFCAASCDSFPPLRSEPYRCQPLHGCALHRIALPKNRVAQSYGLSCAEQTVRAKTSLFK